VPIYLVLPCFFGFGEMESFSTVVGFYCKVQLHSLSPTDNKNVSFNQDHCHTKQQSLLMAEDNIQSLFRMIQEQVFVRSNLHIIPERIQSLSETVYKEHNLKPLSSDEIADRERIYPILRGILSRSILPKERLRIYDMNHLHLDHLVLLEHIQSHMRHYYLITQYYPDWLPPDCLLPEDYCFSLVTESQIQQSMKRRSKILEEHFSNALRRAEKIKREMESAANESPMILASHMLRRGSTKSMGYLSE
jgi:hypothetical protein